ncbi:hypothetical protein P3S67_023370 [Capsicum chacoense]
MDKKIMTSVNENKGEFFFLYGFGGIGKAFIWKTLSTFIRSKGDIVLTIASNGIASVLLPSGRTTHSRFLVPLNVMEDSTCNIKQALDKTLRDILGFKDSSNSQRPFRGKTVVLGGDFRQLLPVIPKGTRKDIVNATLNYSYLWPHCQLLTLTKNMRLQGTETGTHLDELRDFSNCILDVGDSRIGSSFDRIEKVRIPNDLLINESINTISSIVESTYSDFISCCNDLGYLQQRTILASTLDMVESINQYMISLNHNLEKLYLSSDKICNSDHTYSALEHIHTPKFLNTNHAITLKVEVPVMLLRNID